MTRHVGGPRRWLAATVCALAAVTAGACRSAPETASGYIVVAQRASPNSIHPLLASDEATARIAQLVFSTLLDIGEDLRPRPRLAERLENPTPTTYVAYLHRGVRFHDGTSLTAADVVYTYRLLLDPSFTSPFKGAFTALQAVDALDDHTVRFTLKEPFGAFPMQLVPIPILPEGRSAEMITHPVGSGPYRFVSYSVDDRLELAAFDDYYEGPPANRGLLLKIIPDDTMRGLELRKGSVDVVINEMNPDVVHGLEERGDVIVKRVPGLDYSYIGINVQHPPLDDRRVRQAIGYAINREAIIK